MNTHLAEHTSNFTSPETQIQALKQQLAEATAALQAQKKLQYPVHLLNHVPVAVIGMDEHFIIQYFNLRAERLFGLAAENVLGQDIQRVIQYNTYSRDPKSILIALAQGELPCVEWEQYNQRGESMVAEIHNAALLNAEGQVEGYVTTVRDVTWRRAVEDALRESETRFRVLVDSMDDLIFTLDSQLRHTGVYGDWVERLGMQPRDFLGKTAEEILGNEASAIHMQASRQALTGKQVVYEWIASSPTETTFYQTRLSPIRSSDGMVQGLVGVGRDITELKRAEEILAEYARKLERSNQELEEFACVASHDLQEPLRKISSFSENLYKKLDARLSEDERDRFKRIIAVTSRLQLMIRDLLDLSRVFSQGQPFQEIDLRAVVAEVVSDLDLHIGRINGQVMFESLPVIVADASQMHSLFLNLIGNALKYHCLEKPPVVKIRGTVLKSKRGAMVQIRVEDNGIGFDMQHMERIFQPFQRLHGRDEYDGTGIGLAVCKKIVERHGGDLTARSTTGVGSVFIVTLPVTPLV